MRKIVSACIIVISLFASSCGSSPSTAIVVATPIIRETAELTQSLDLPTPGATPTLGKLSDDNGGLIVTLGEKVNRQGWWPAIPAFSPDGKVIALVSERVTLWDVKTHQLIYELGKPYSNCYTENAIFSSDSRFLAASIYSYENTTGYVLVWDTESGILLQQWEQAFSKDTSKIEGILNSRPATGIAFLPKSSILAFANGNSIEMRDVQENSESVVLKLGNEMFASNLAISDNGKQLFVFMDFLYNKTPNELGQRYALQTWDLESKKIVDNVEFPEPDNTGFFAGHSDVVMKLSGKVLVNLNYIDQVFTATQLETGEIRNLYYRGDVKTFISQDANYVVYLPNFPDDFNCKNQSIELWDTKVNQNLYAFKTSNKDFETKWCYGPNTMIFNPDNTILAIAHEERVSLFDFSSFTKPKESSTP